MVAVGVFVGHPCGTGADGPSQFQGVLALSSALFLLLLLSTRPWFVNRCSWPGCFSHAFARSDDNLCPSLDARWRLQIANEIRPVLAKFSAPVPAVLEIPSKEHPYDASKDSILQRVRNMLGTS